MKKIFFGVILAALSSTVIFAGAAEAKPRKRPPIAKIIDGQRVPVSQYPFVAEMRVDGETYCTGTLVGPRHVLTAAHCFFDDRNRRAVGPTDMSAVLNGVEYPSANVYIHPSFRSRSEACVEGETDAAVVELTTDVVGVDIITIVDGSPPIGTPLVLAGFGLEGEGSGGQTDSFPPSGFVNVGSTVLEGFGANPPKQNPSSTYIFWTFDGGEANTASGDSGGPAFFELGGVSYLAAITCGGEGNAEIGTLSFDTRADLIKDWVLSITGATPGGTAPSFPKLGAQTTKLGDAFSYTIPVNGTSPVQLSVSGLPGGITFDGVDTISGVSTAAGSFNVAISAANDFGSASSTLKLTVSGFDPALSIKKALLQFDYEAGARDFLDITGSINVGRKFRPGGKKATIQIGRYTKNFKLRSDGLSNSGNRNFFDLVGAFKGNAFKKASVKYFLTFERVQIFDELATLGFPASAVASEGQEVSLPLTITINGVESATTAVLTFSTRDSRWRVKK